MTDYCIQKKTDDPYKIRVNGGWVEAWGLKPRSFPKASNDEEAILIFAKETAKSRCEFRLIKWGGYGYGVFPLVLANKPVVIRIIKKQ